MSLPTIARQRWIAAPLQQASAAALRLRSRCPEPAGLAAALYADWYSAPRVPEAEITATAATMPPDLTSILRVAHDSTNQPWERGFEIVDVGRDGRVICRRGNDTRLLERCDYFVESRPGTLARRGDLAMVTSRRERIAPGHPWWYTYSPDWPLDTTPPGLARIYWHMSLVALPTLVEMLTRAMARTDRDWMMKVAIDPTVHGRADACVLYVPLGALSELSEQIEWIAESLAWAAQSAGPPMTLAVRPGCAAAVDPSSGESFGEHRCRLIAEAVAGADWNITAALNAIAQRFDTEGIDPSAPWQAIDDGQLPWT